MNEIPIIQNSEQQLKRLAAQRNLYSTAKTIFGVQLILAGPIAVLWASVVNFYPAIKGYSALWGCLVVLSDLFWLTPWQKHLRAYAARIQEMFDCDVLSLPLNELKNGKHPESELAEVVDEQSVKYKRWAHKMSPLADWYSKEVVDLPLYIARIACQRANCWWDATQRRRYAVWIIVSLTAICGVVLAFTLKSHLTIEDFLVKIVAPLAPALVLGIRQVVDQMETADNLDKLKGHSESLWNEALNGALEVTITAKARSLQDEIFENRKRGALVFDWVFKWLRNDYELQMNRTTADLVKQAKKRLGI